jgi:RNA polymerase-binding transcription factor DksA
MSFDLEARREELLELRARLTSAAEYMEHADDNGGELSSSAGDQHLADHATDMLDRELDETLEENAEHVLREIDEALARLDAGTYGTCAVCGDEIPEERLAAIPYATLCIADKRKQERR